MSPLENPNITLGTAGHVDHGKTELIKFLTGCDTDRLKEEKERGLSIDLGFAPCTIMQKQLGIVDVPGHEDFIRTMVAGASCMDGVILVVAADDGVMPQTREHLEIVELLGVRHGVVALTKIDLVDDGGVELARLELGEFLETTSLRDAPIIEMCSLTGEGFDEFYEALARLVDSIEAKSTEGVFRLPIDRSFSVRGYGTVVAGVPVSGSAGVGDEVELLPQGQKGVIRGIEVYGEPAERVVAGQCAALNVRHWQHDEIARGDTAATPGVFTPGEWFAAELSLLPHETVFVRNGDRVKLHTGTSEVQAALYLMEGNRIVGGQDTLVQFRAAQPLVAAPGDRFIIRSLTPPRTIGGGRIVEALRRRLRRTKEGVREDLAERASALSSPTDIVEYCVRTADRLLADADAVAKRAKLTRRQTLESLAALTDAGRTYRLPSGKYVHTETVEAIGMRVSEALAQYHAQHPTSRGMPLAELVEALDAPEELVTHTVDVLADGGGIAAVDGLIARAEHRVTESPQQQRVLEAVGAALREGRFRPPSVDGISKQTGLPEEEVRWALDILMERGEVIEVEDQLLFHAEAVEEARQMLADYIRNEGGLESVKYKYLLDTTRKYAIPLLDYFDRVGVTVRQGYTRFLRE